MADISAALSLFTDFTSKTDSLTKTIDQVKKINKIAEEVAKQFQKVVSVVESYVQLDAKLGLMTDSLEEHSKLQDMIVSSANKARSSYADMVNIVTKLGLSTGNLFSSNQEVVSFSELLQKSLVASGTSDDKKSLVIQQMADALASGSMGSSDLISIAQNAPVIYDTIAKFTGKSGNELLAMAAKGDLTAKVIKDSMFGMQEEIENQLSQMPLTFSDIMNNVKNAGTDAFGNLFIAINDLLTSPDLINFFNTIVNVIYFLGDAIDNVIDVLTTYWPVIESILMAIGVLLLVNVIGYLIAAIPLLLGHLALLWATNAPLVALIITIAAAIYLLRTMGEETMAFIGGVFGFIISFLINVIFAISQLIFGLIEFVVNLMFAFANFIDNIFNDPIGTIIRLFFDLADIVLNVLEKIASAIDFIFGSNFADTIKGWRAELQVTADAAIKAGSNGNYVKKNELDINQLLSDNGITMNRKNYEDGWNIGQDIGGEIGKKIEGFLGGNSGSLKGVDTNNKNTDKTKDVTDTNNILLNDLFSSNNLYGENWNPTLLNNKENNSGFDTYGLGLTNSINSNNTSLPAEGKGPGGGGEVDISDDDLNYLREMAERDYIANIANNSLAPNISVQFGDVHETADVNQVAGKIKQILQEEIAMVSEGVY